MRTTTLASPASQRWKHYHPTMPEPPSLSYDGGMVVFCAMPDPAQEVPSSLHQLPSTTRQACAKPSPQAQQHGEPLGAITATTSALRSIYQRHCPTNTSIFFSCPASAILPKKSYSDLISGAFTAEISLRQGVYHRRLSNRRISPFPRQSHA